MCATFGKRRVSTRRIRGKMTHLSVQNKIFFLILHQRIFSGKFEDRFPGANESELSILQLALKAAKEESNLPKQHL